MPAVVADVPGGAKGSRSKFQILFVAAATECTVCTASLIEQHLQQYWTIMSPAQKPVPIPVFIPHSHVLNAE